MRQDNSPMHGHTNAFQVWARFFEIDVKIEGMESTLCSSSLSGLSQLRASLPSISSQIPAVSLSIPRVRIPKATCQWKVPEVRGDLACLAGSH